jgi:hypothetical protein
MRLNRFLISFLCATVATSASAAFARTRLAAARSPNPARAEPAKPEAAWFASYEEARAAMLAGNFAVAAAQFTVLVGSAPDPGARFLATEMMTACQTWAAGGLVLSQPQQTSLAPPALLADRRTTDELAILYTNAVLFGLYAGLVIDVWNEPDSPSGAVLPPLLMAGAFAGTVALLDKTLNLRYGVAQSMVAGLYIGIEEALCWSLWHEAHSPYSSEWGEKTVTTLILGVGTLGAVAGGVVGSYLGTTPGRASLMGSAAMWSGLVAGTLVGGLTEKDDTALLSSAIVLNAGAIAGVVAGSMVSPSIARVRFVDLGGLSGGILVGGLYWALADRDATAKGTLISTSLGMAAGLATAWILTGNMEKDQPRRRQEASLAERLMPSLAPVAGGKGFVLGVASTI